MRLTSNINVCSRTQFSLICAMARNRQSSDNEYPKELIGQAVVDLRIVFAAYQRSEESREITLLQLYNIVLLIFPDGDKPSAEDLAEMCGISKTHASWHSQIDFKQFVRFFINHMDTSSFPAVSRDIFRAMDCDDSGEITAEELGTFVSFHCTVFSDNGTC